MPGALLNELQSPDADDLAVQLRDHPLPRDRLEAIDRLAGDAACVRFLAYRPREGMLRPRLDRACHAQQVRFADPLTWDYVGHAGAADGQRRSEERRVGKEGRAGGAA